MISNSESHIHPEDIFFESQSQSQNDVPIKLKDKLAEKHQPKLIQLFPLYSKFPEDFQERYSSDQQPELHAPQPFLNFKPNTADPNNTSNSSLFCYDNFPQSIQLPSKGNSEKSSSSYSLSIDIDSKSGRKARQTITQDKLQVLNVIFQNYIHNKSFMKCDYPQENIQGQKMIKDLIKRRPEFRSLSDKILSISSVAEISGIVNLAQSTILHKLKEYKEVGEVKAGPRVLSKYVKQKYKKSFQIQNCIMKALSERPFYSAIELSKYISARYNLNYSRCLINRHLKDMGFNLSMSSKNMKKVNSQEIKQIRYKYVTSLEQYQLRIKSENIIYVDQLIIEKENIMNRKNIEVIMEEKGNNNQWIQDNFVSVLVAMDQICVLYFKIKLGVFDKTDFLSSMNELKERTNFDEEDQEQVLVLDLHPIHLPDQERKRPFPFRRLYLPPYTPHLNPCLNLFADIKQRKINSVKSNNINSLLEWVKIIMLQISSKSVSHYFTKVSMVKRKALYMENF